MGDLYIFSDPEGRGIKPPFIKQKLAESQLIMFIENSIKRKKELQNRLRKVGFKYGLL
jgi:hypothetical protein